MNLRTVFTVIIYSIFALSVYSQSSVEKANDGSSKYNYLMLEAERQSSQGNYAVAFDLYNYCLKLNPQSGSARYSISTLLRFMRNDSLATKRVEEAVALYPDNYWYNDMLVKMYYNNGDVDKAQKTLENMATKFPKKTDVLMMLIDTYAQKQDYENLIRTLNKLEIKEGKSEQLSMEKFRIYVQMKDEKSAFKEMRDLANEYPNDLRYQVLIGDLYLDQGTEESKAKALAQYKAVEAKDSTNLTMMLSLSNYYQREGNDSLCMDYLLRLVTNPSLDRKVRLQLVGGIVYENLKPDGDSTKILNMFDKILSMPQEDAAMHELCATYMVNANLSIERIKPVLKKMLEVEPENERARNQLLSYAIEEEDTASIMSLCKPACDFGAKDPVYYFYLGVVYYQQNNYNSALETFQKGISHVGDKSSVELIVRLHSLSGDIYHLIGQPEKAYVEYDSCLIYRPDDAYVLNNYAYYLSLEKKNLEKAEVMSRRSNELDKDNPTNIDTYAWVLFQQKKYEEAKGSIDHAVELLGDTLNVSDATIIEHAGDIYYRCGDVEKALEFWNSARNLSTDKNVLKDEQIKALDRKIRRKKL
ncbi:MAG: tetratricopeptide repeat protein [Bacteroidaceae bacterium]|nr:tetratricopeptide repeat protein [Bacteroidaceae bacterium]